MASSQQYESQKGQTVSVTCKAYPGLLLGITEDGKSVSLLAPSTTAKQEWMKVELKDGTGKNICAFMNKETKQALYSKGDEVALTPEKVEDINLSMLNVLWTEKERGDKFKTIFKAVDVIVWTAEKMEGVDGIKIMLLTEKGQENQGWETQTLPPM